METLKIYKEYKFKIGENEFYISEHQKLKVKLKSGEVYEGKLLIADEAFQVIEIDVEDDIIYFECKDVVEIMKI